MAEVDKNSPDDRLKVISFGLSLIKDGVPPTTAWTKTSTRFGVDRSTIYRWFSLVDGSPQDDWLRLLKPKRRPGNKGRKNFHPEAYKMLVDLAKDNRSISAAYSEVKLVSKAKGWPFPSLRTVQRWLVEDGIEIPTRYDNI